MDSTSQSNFSYLSHSKSKLATILEKNFLQRFFKGSFYNEPLYFVHYLAIDVLFMSHITFLVAEPENNI